MHRAYDTNIYFSLKIRNCIIKLISLQYCSLIIQKYLSSSQKKSAIFSKFCLNVISHITIIVSNYSFFDKRLPKKLVQINISG